jgi:hypothetical protein
MSEEPSDPRDEAADPEPRPPGGFEGRAHWTVPVVGAEPDWSPLRRATRVAVPQDAFAWTAAHRLPDGTRIDVYVHRRTHRAVHVDPLGRSWTRRGFAPGAVGVSLLLEPGPSDDPGARAGPPDPRRRE